MDATHTNTQTATPQGPISIGEFNVRVSDLTLRYGENVALKMARRERKLRHPLHKRATARRVEMADAAIKMTGTFHPL